MEDGTQGLSECVSNKPLSKTKASHRKAWLLLVWVVKPKNYTIPNFPNEDGKVIRNREGRGSA